MIRFLTFPIVLLVFLTATPAAEVKPAKPNILFVLADDMRPDCIHVLGHPVVETPNLDSLVSSGIVFTRAVAAYPICYVSRAEIITGASAFRNGSGYRGTAIDPSFKTWAGTLRAAGYHTWFSGKWHNDGKPTERGYEATRGLYTGGGAPKDRIAMPDHAGRKSTGYSTWTFKTEEGKVELEKGVGLTPDTDRYIADGAIELLRRRPAEPFFMHVSFTAPHDPRIWPRGFENKYIPARIPLPANFRPQHPFDHGNINGRDEKILPKPLKEDELRAELAVYYACISHLDAQLGRIISVLRENGQLANTVIIFSSDQGLALGSHGLLGKQNLYEHTFRVPFIFSGPGIPKGQRSEADCYLRDVFPTTCELAGIPIPETVEAHSLVPLLRGSTQPIYPFVIGYFTDTQRGIRQGDWKLIRYLRTPRTQLFNLREDPNELNDVSNEPANTEIIQRLRTELDAWLKEHGDKAVQPQ